MIGRPAADRGIVMIEMVVVGFAVLALVLPTIVLTARMVEASDIATGEARSAALWYARHGALPGSDHDSELTVQRNGDEVRVVATVRVELLSVGGTGVSTTVSGSFAMPISPYRSGR
ncbi:MAG: hypothetical protein R2823_06940 [Acidimicrobiia bacterium]